eukprot:TRINITY_DN24051_c0_g1_i2.p1 TRINITY_DN24051_c0_g1~~TRINITY_DN24051_c0_g1_i2.p1  ORF type:complete len:481 (-),score=103.83 TRINITY_DN24051_c0_g1_i2:336-1778(-)
MLRSLVGSEMCIRDSAATVELECYRDGQLIETVSLEAGKHTYKVGRGKDCAVVLKHPSLSRHHAEISIQGTNVFVMDTDSSHGSYVDGKRLQARAPHLLKPDSEAWFGGSTRRYRLGRVMVKRGATDGVVDAAKLDEQRRRNDELARAFKHLLRPGHGLDIAPDGYVLVSDVMANGAMRNYNATEDEVKEMVKWVPALFEITEHTERGLLIRTRMMGNEGLFRAPLVEINSERVLEFKELVYWGLFGEWNLVRSEGLIARDREPIVLMQHAPSSADKIPGTSSKPQIAVVIDVARAVEHGIKFYWTGEHEQGQVVCAGDHENKLKPTMYINVSNARDGSVLMAHEEIQRLQQQEEEQAVRNAKKEAEMASKRQVDETRGIIEGTEAVYKPTGQAVTVLKAHYDEVPPYYTVRMPDGREKQTIADKLESIEVHDLRDKEKREEKERMAAAGLGDDNPLLKHMQMDKKSKFDSGRRKKRLKM